MVAATETIARPPVYTKLENDRAIVFDHTGGNCWNVSLQSRYSRPYCLGAIEYNTHTQNWYITHVGREPLSKLEGLPYVSWSDSSIYLYEEFLHQRRQRVRAAIAD